MHAQPTFCTTHILIQLHRTFQQQQSSYTVGVLQGSVGTSLFKAFGRLWLIGCIFSFIGNCVGLTSPFLLREFLLSIPSQEPHARFTSLAWVVAMFMVSMTHTVLSTQHDNYMREAGISMHKALQQFIYAKSFRLSMQAKAKFERGKLTEMIESDSHTVVGIMDNVHYLWIAPLEARALKQLQLPL